MVRLVWFMLGLLVLFLILSVVLYLGKGSALIAGYNTLPKEEQAKYDKVALGKFMGKSMFAISSAVGLWVIASYFMIDWLFYVGTGLIVLIVVFMVAYANTGNRFKKDESL